MSETYSVVVSGQLVEGFELHQVKVNMTQAFKLSEAQVDKLLCGKPVALKRGIEKNLAVKLILLCRILRRTRPGISKPITLRRLRLLKQR